MPTPLSPRASSREAVHAASTANAMVPSDERSRCVAMFHPARESPRKGPFAQSEVIPYARDAVPALDGRGAPAHIVDQSVNKGDGTL